MCCVFHVKMHTSLYLYYHLVGEDNYPGISANHAFSHQRWDFDHYWLTITACSEAFEFRDLSTDEMIRTRITRPSQETFILTSLL
jgi:hypothetical protein